MTPPATPQILYPGQVLSADAVTFTPVQRSPPLAVHTRPGELSEQSRQSGAANVAASTTRVLAGTGVDFAILPEMDDMAGANLERIREEDFADATRSDVVDELGGEASPEACSAPGTQTTPAATPVSRPMATRLPPNGPRDARCTPGTSSKGDVVHVCVSALPQTGRRVYRRT